MCECEGEAKAVMPFVNYYGKRSVDMNIYFNQFFCHSKNCHVHRNATEIYFEHLIIVSYRTACFNNHQSHCSKLGTCSRILLILQKQNLIVHPVLSLGLIINDFSTLSYSSSVSSFSACHIFSMHIAVLKP